MHEFGVALGRRQSRLRHAVVTPAMNPRPPEKSAADRNQRVFGNESHAWNPHRWVCGSSHARIGQKTREHGRRQSDGSNVKVELKPRMNERCHQGRCGSDRVAQMTAGNGGRPREALMNEPAQIQPALPKMNHHKSRQQRQPHPAIVADHLKPVVVDKAGVLHPCGRGGGTQSDTAVIEHSSPGPQPGMFAVLVQGRLPDQ